MIDDLALRRSVENELAWDSRFDATNIAVSAQDGTVTLTGHVSSYPELFMVRDAVLKVSGVKAVADEIKLRIPSSHIRDDSDIARSVTHVLENNVHLPDSNIQANVNNGSVALTGEVDWQCQRTHVEEQIAHVRGVKNISNHITLRKRLVASNVKEQIEAALARNAKLEAEHVSVTVEGNEVKLSGKVKSLYERNLVEAAAWHAPGVTRVIDKIEIG